MYQVVKRDGKVVDFHIDKISAAITKAFDATGKPYHPSIIDLIAIHVTSDYQDKIVIAPPKWLPNNSVTDIYLDSWTIL